MMILCDTIVYCDSPYFQWKTHVIAIISDEKMLAEHSVPNTTSTVA